MFLRTFYIPKLVNNILNELKKKKRKKEEKNIDI